MNFSKINSHFEERSIVQQKDLVMLKQWLTNQDLTYLECAQFTTSGKRLPVFDEVLKIKSCLKNPNNPTIPKNDQTLKQKLQQLKTELTKPKQCENEAKNERFEKAQGLLGKMVDDIKNKVKYTTRSTKKHTVDLQ
jgi:hypothetical protein